MNKKNVLKVVCVVGCVLVLSGCGSVFGVREFQVWEGGPKWEFMQGQDFHVGMNGIDNVKDQRGVSGGYSEPVSSTDRRNY